MIIDLKDLDSALVKLISEDKHAMLGYNLAQASNAGDAILTTSYQDNYITKGNAFQIQRRIPSIPTTPNYKSVLDFSGLDSNKIVFLLPLIFSATGGPVHIKTYRITSYTGGTAYPINRLNNLPSNLITSQAVVKHGITTADVEGDDLREYELGATGNPQQVNRAGASTGAASLIIPPGAILCLDVDNNYTDVINLTVGAVWYEIEADI